MILKASQRGGSAQLAAHLLSHDNEHVELGGIRGFASDDLPGAMKEAYAVSMGTRCRQHLFSISLSPPPDQTPGTEVFEDALSRIENKLGLSKNARVLMYHTKEARLHLHAVYSRIDPETMKAVQLSHFKLKLRDTSRALYLEHGWKMPRGLMNSADRDPRNFNLAEYQQARREGLKGQDLKAIIQECYAVSDSLLAFQQVLKSRGMTLCRGDRRSHVVLTTKDEVLSVARYTGRRTKDIRAKLGSAEALPSLEEARKAMTRDMARAFRRHTDEARTLKQRDLAALEERRKAMSAHHRVERTRLDAAMEARRIAETRERSDRLNKGLKGLFQRIIGEARRAQKANEKEAYSCFQRDREQRQRLIEAQLAERRVLQIDIEEARKRHTEQLRELRRDAAPYRGIHKEESLSRQFEQRNAPREIRLPTPEERVEKLREKKREQVQTRKGPTLER